ncbi:MAG: UPF0175 family protein [Armatimonadetes bacterium]|nr:UPF0175 family protein [Armatimonadota bacterium]
MSLVLEIPDSVAGALLLPPAEREERLRQELAVTLYALEILGFGKARELAELGHYEFGQLLGRRGVPRQYGQEELDEDLAAVERLRREAADAGSQ